MAQSHIRYEGDVDDSSHALEWLQNYGEIGAFQFSCDTDGGSIILSAGWGRLSHCPMCGTGIEVNTSEV